MTNDLTYMLWLNTEPHTAHAVQLTCKPSEREAVEAWLAKVGRWHLAKVVELVVAAETSAPDVEWSVSFTKEADRE